jgi:SAM-dependent methyltransferase
MISIFGNEESVMSTQNKSSDRVIVTDKNFNEKDYLASNPDVANAVRKGLVFSGRSHFILSGRNESRTMRVTVSNTVGISPNKMQELYAWIVDASLAIKKVILRSSYRIRNPQSLDSDWERLETLENQVNDSEASLKQVMSILNWEANLPLPPPKHLQIRVVGKYDQHFIDSGMNFYPVLNRLLSPVGKELKDFQSILDFGCGCGRAIRALATLLPNNKLYGADIDEEAITWLENHYSKFGEFSVVPHIPPTIYKDQMFDFIFGVSVMTHLPENMQFQWLEELSRITKPGGYVMLSTHGVKTYQSLGKDINDIMETKGFFHYQLGGFNYGKSISLPDFYQTTFHSHSYIQQKWNKYFDVIDIQTAGLDERQDGVLLQKR